MALEVSRFDVYEGTVKDKPGGVAEVLQGLAAAGANIDALFACRVPGKGKKGSLVVGPLTNRKQANAANTLGLKKSAGSVMLRITLANKKGGAADIFGALAEAGINLQSVFGTVLGRRAVAYIRLDNAKDASLAARILRKL